ncbi:CobW family GTP-binding protein [Nocardioides pacificus]
MRTPLVLITGVHPEAIDSVMMSLSWDLPETVVVRHRIDPESQVLTRVVSHAGGVLEREEIELEHACVSCALREDIVPTLERLARDARWGSIVAGLPTATEAVRLSALLARDTRLARHLRLAGIVTAMGGPRLVGDLLVDDLLGDDLLRERGWHSNPGDERGVGEVACAQLELADVVVLDADQEPQAVDLVRALARPDAVFVAGADRIDAAALVAGRHRHASATQWSSPLLEVDVPTLGKGHAWRLDLSSTRPFHPDRLLDQIELLGAGRHRSRGCFWVPTRPDLVLEWSGAGGQLSIGRWGGWGRRSRRTHLVLTGVGPLPAELADAFRDLLLTPDEMGARSRWNVLEDGLEPWLGDIRDVA